MRAQNTELYRADPEAVLRSVTDKMCCKLRLSNIPEDIRISDTVPDDEPKRAENVMGQLGEIIDTKCHKLHRVFSSLSEIYELSVNMTQSLAKLSTTMSSPHLKTVLQAMVHPIIQLNIPAGIIMQEVTGTKDDEKDKGMVSECFPRPVRLKTKMMQPKP